MFWRPTKKEIVEWMEMKEQEFSRGENRNPWMINKQWLQRYVFTELHDIFFGEFMIILMEWLERLVENIGRYQTIAPRNSTPDLVRQLNFVSNTTSHTVDF
jgi:hypothetical protein